MRSNQSGNTYFRDIRQFNDSYNWSPKNQVDEFSFSYTITEIFASSPFIVVFEGRMRKVVNQIPTGIMEYKSPKRS